MIETNKTSRHAGGAKIQVHLHQIRCHLRPERHLHRLLIPMYVNVPKAMVYHLDMCIYILLFPMLSFSILIHMPRITSAIMILMQICSLMNEHQVDSSLSAAW